MLHIAICDDERSFAANLEAMIRKYAKDCCEELKITTYYDGSQLIEKYDTTIDLIFLDIQMNVTDGLKAAGQIRKMDTKVGIIFLTSLVNYALEGYKYQAVNYILKPIKYVRLKSELDKWLEHYRRSDDAFIVVRNDSGIYKIFLNTLHYLETSNRNVLLHTDSGHIVSYKKMKDFENELSSRGFVRCHTGYLVNLYFVKRVEKLELELTDGARLPISQPKRKAVMERLADYWGDML